MVSGKVGVLPSETIKTVDVGLIWSVIRSLLILVKGIRKQRAYGGDPSVMRTSKSSAMDVTLTAPDWSQVKNCLLNVSRRFYNVNFTHLSKSAVHSSESSTVGGSWRF